MIPFRQAGMRALHVEESTCSELDGMPVLEGKRIRYEELIADNGLLSGARSNEPSRAS